MQIVCCFLLSQIIVIIQFNSIQLPHTRTTMSHLTYYSYDGVGKRNREQYKYSQAVRIGDRIECSEQGQSRTSQPVSINAPNNQIKTGGWDHATGVFHREINAQIDQAVANVELNLKDAGGKGWEQVFRVNSYHAPLNNEALEAMVRNFKRYTPDHQPLWTVVGASRLGEDDMRVEIEVVAHDP